jgi:hypothetical protein
MSFHVAPVVCKGNYLRHLYNTTKTAFQDLYRTKTVWSKYWSGLQQLTPLLMPVQTPAAYSRRRTTQSADAARSRYARAPEPR